MIHVHIMIQNDCNETNKVLLLTLTFVAIIIDDMKASIILQDYLLLFEAKHFFIFKDHLFIFEVF